MDERLRRLKEERFAFAWEGGLSISWDEVLLSSGRAPAEEDGPTESCEANGAFRIHSRVLKQKSPFPCIPKVVLTFFGIPMGSFIGEGALWDSS
jgi:hypothetical protein